MLWKLYIKNLAVIKELSLTLNGGLNVFTGETGAGKSIVIDAISAVLGARTKKELVRDNEKYATIIATFFDVDKRVNAMLQELNIEPEEGLILERLIYFDGKSIAKINSHPVPISVIKNMSQYLINIHGQHDTQILLNPQKHIDILDSLVLDSDIFNQYKIVYKRVVEIKREINKLRYNEQEKQQLIDLLSYQINEIENSNLKMGEDEELISSRELMKNSAKITTELASSYRALTTEDGLRGNEYVSVAAKHLSIAADYYKQIAPLFDRMLEISYELVDVATEISNILDSISYDENILNEIEDRLYLIDNLKSKYGKTIEEILEFKINAQNELERINLSDEIIKKLEIDGKQEYLKLIELAKFLTNSRINAAKLLEEKIDKELSFLDMPNTKLVVDIKDTKLNLSGKDAVEILISTNKGQAPKSISKIASGGELSRIMLSFKNAISEKDEISTMIFDEIDTGVSGNAAQKIGLKLKEAAKNKQILAVTHSAQVAALADHQYLIKKYSDETSTYTTVEELELNQRALEIARIMSTGEIPNSLLEMAMMMIKKGQE